MQTKQQCFPPVLAETSATPSGLLDPSGNRTQRSLEMLSLKPCSRAKKARRGTSRCRMKIPNTNNTNKQRIKRPKTNLVKAALWGFSFSFFHVYPLTRVVLYTMWQAGDVCQWPSLWGSNYAQCNSVAMFVWAFIMIAFGTFKQALHRESSSNGLISFVEKTNVLTFFIWCIMSATFKNSC